MANQSQLEKIKDKIQQAIEKISEALDEWLNQQRPQRQTIPVSVDRPVRRK